mmetsp:Transcript_28888/g.97386  ORF Transcript_28888/g.97386 Transcript_28888/m.97386 type:complete len:209 (+) Transcript_28888:4960-5586(+)
MLRPPRRERSGQDDYNVHGHARHGAHVRRRKGRRIQRADGIFESGKRVGCGEPAQHALGDPFLRRPPTRLCETPRPRRKRRGSSRARHSKTRRAGAALAQAGKGAVRRHEAQTLLRRRSHRRPFRRVAGRAFGGVRSRLAEEPLESAQVDHGGPRRRLDDAFHARSRCAVSSHRHHGPRPALLLGHARAFKSEVCLGVRARLQTRFGG